MAIKLIGNYAKRLGLPGYSSHQFSVSDETELTDSGDIQGEATRIYHLLQDAVDRQIQETGFVPDDGYGFSDNSSSRAETNGNHNGQHRLNGGNGHNGNGSNGQSDSWSCSEKQKKFIEKLIAENNLDQDTVEEIARDRFGLWIWQLNKLQASGLISELLESVSKNGKSRNGEGGHR
ncbi:MAG: hypothetical protein MI807_19110 [Verrucomicrobiales bacterium]|nr:hypothetical protein [Verrucomicrobiales bacterium]